MGKNLEKVQGMLDGKGMGKIQVGFSLYNFRPPYLELFVNFYP